MAIWVHPPEGATVTGPLGRAESNGGGFQKLIPRFTPSSRPISVNWVLRRRPGPVQSPAFSHDDERLYLLVTNGITGHVNVFDCCSLQKLSALGARNGSSPLAGEFKLVHSIGTDSQGNLYVTETGGLPCRVQKFVRVS